MVIFDHFMKLVISAHRWRLKYLLKYSAGKPCSLVTLVISFLIYNAYKASTYTSVAICALTKFSYSECPLLLKDSISLLIEVKEVNLLVRLILYFRSFIMLALKRL